MHAISRKIVPLLTAALLFASAQSAFANPPGPGWTHQNVALGSNTQIFDIDLSGAPQGGANVFWDGYEDFNGGINYVRHVHYTHDSGAAAPEYMPQGSDNITYPQSASGADGSGIASWSTNSGAFSYALMQADGTIDAPVGVSDENFGYAHVATDHDGNSIFVWSMYGGDSVPRIKAIFIPAGGPASSPVTILEGPVNGNVWDPHPVFDASGMAHIVFSSYDDSTITVSALSVTPSGVVVGDVTPVVSTPANGPTWVSNVAVSDAGALFVATTSLVNMFQFETKMSLLPAGATSAVDLNFGADSNPGFGGVAGGFFGDGSGVVTYGTSDYALHSIRFAADGSQSDFVELAGPVQVGEPQIVVDRFDTATVVFNCWECSEAQTIYASRMPKDGEWSEVEPITSGASTYEAKAAVDDDGNVTVVGNNLTNAILTQYIAEPHCEDAAASSHAGATVIGAVACSGVGHLTYEIVDPPQHGTATIDPDTGEITYTPEPGFSGADSLTFRTNGDGGPSQLHTFAIDVTAAPASAPAPGAALAITRFSLTKHLLPRLAEKRRSIDLSFVLSKNADVRLSIVRRYGRAAGSKCRRTPRGENRRARCALGETAFAKSLGAMGAGPHGVSLTAATLQQHLRPGEYLMKVTASDSHGSVEAMRRFRVHWKSPH